MGIFSSSSSSSKPKTVPNLTPDQSNLLSKLLSETSGSVGKAATPFPNQLYAPTSAYDENYINQSQSSPDQLALYKTALNQALSGQPAYEVDPAQREAYYQSAFVDPMMRQYQQDIMPGVMEAASGAGFYSGDTLRQLGNSATDFATQLAAQRANLLWQDVQSGYNAQENAAQRQAMLAGTPQNILTGTAATAGEGAAYARQLEQEKIMSELQRWLSGEEVNGSFNSAYNPNTSLALALLGVQPYSIAGQSSSSGPGLGYSVLNGLAEGMSNYNYSRSSNPNDSGAPRS